MLKFKKSIEDRKELVRRLGELTGIRPMYTMSPRYTYIIGKYAVGPDGELAVEPEDADAGILTTLKEEGLIGEGRVEDGEAIASEDVQAEETEEPAAGETIEAENVQEVIEEEPAEESEAETGEANEEPGTEETVAEDAVTDEVEQLAGVDMGMDIPVPIGNHNGLSLRNLVNLIYSRGGLISKATGGELRVDEELVERLKDDTCTFTRQNFLGALAEYEQDHGAGLHGIRITEDEIIFTGFGVAADIDHLTAYGQLALLMSEQAIRQKRIQAKHVDDSNEKYALRIWLIRIGMGGDEFKKARKVLMENLDGHTAFRTQAEADKAKAKVLQKRAALKAAKAAAQAEEDGTV